MQLSREADSPARNRENEIDTLSEVKDSFESGPELPLPLVTVISLLPISLSLLSSYSILSCKSSYKPLLYNQPYGLRRATKRSWC